MCLNKSLIPDALSEAHLCLFPAADFKEPRLVDGPIRRKSLVDTGGGGISCTALHHPHLYGPADHCSHHKPQRAQTQGQTLLVMVFGLKVTHHFPSLVSWVPPPA